MVRKNFCCLFVLKLSSKDGEVKVYKLVKLKDKKKSKNLEGVNCIKNEGKVLMKVEEV